MVHRNAGVRLPIDTVNRRAESSSGKYSPEDIPNASSAKHSPRKTHITSAAKYTLGEARPNRTPWTTCNPRQCYVARGHIWYKTSFNPIPGKTEIASRSKFENLGTDLWTHASIPIIFKDPVRTAQ